MKHLPATGWLAACGLLCLALAGGCAATDAADEAAADECRVHPLPDPAACTMEWNPVCGCDGRTYGNACEARAAGVIAYERGACEGDASLR